MQTIDFINSSDHDTSYWDDEFGNDDQITQKEIGRKVSSDKRNIYVTKKAENNDIRSSRRKSTKFPNDRKSHNHRKSSMILNPSMKSKQKVLKRRKSSKSSRTGEIPIKKNERRHLLKNHHENSKKRPFAKKTHTKNDKEKKSLFKVASRYLSRFFEGKKQSSKRKVNKSPPNSYKTRPFAHKDHQIKHNENKDTNETKFYLQKAISEIGGRKVLKTLIQLLETKTNSKSESESETFGYTHHSPKSKENNPKEKDFENSRILKENEDLIIQCEKLNESVEVLKSENFKLKVELQNTRKDKNNEGDFTRNFDSPKKQDQRVTGQRVRFADSVKESPRSAPPLQKKQMWYKTKIETWQKRHENFNEIELREQKERMSLVERREELRRLNFGEFLPH